MHGRHEPLERYFPRAGRPDPARDPREARRRRSFGQRARRALRDEPAGDLQAPEDARTSRADLARPRRAAPTVQDRDQAPRGRLGLARALPRNLGREFRAARRPAGAAADTEKGPQTIKEEIGGQAMAKISPFLWFEGNMQEAV